MSDSLKKKKQTSVELQGLNILSNCKPNTNMSIDMYGIDESAIKEERDSPINDKRFSGQKSSQDNSILHNLSN